jgi:hypothetical protein
MKSDSRIWRIATEMIAQYGSVAEDKAVGLANLMLNSGDRKGQIEWLRIWTAIIVMRGQAE